MKVLIADKISQAGIEALQAQEGLEVTTAFGSSPEQIKELAADVDAIVVRSETKITADVMAAAPNLKAVGRAGVGVDNIDVNAATERGVVVMNTPAGNTVATAELTFTHLLCSARPIAQAYKGMCEGRWDRKQFSGSELRGKTLGILGLGRIGTEVAKRALAFQMRVLAYDPYLTADRAKQLDVEKVELDEALQGADFITVHMPLTDATKGMLNKDAFAKMKDGVRIVNVARGGIIDENDIVPALESGKVKAVGLDVYETEPLAEDSPLRNRPDLVTTPHLGASTEEAQESVGLEIAECIIDVLVRGVIRNAVNAPTVDAKTLQALKPYIRLGEKLGSALQQITPDAIARLHITYWGRIVDLDANPLTRAIQRGYLRKISGPDVNDVNAPGMMQRLGIEVNTTKSGTERAYRELIRIEAECPNGESYSIEGTLVGLEQRPRVVNVNGREVEFSMENVVLVVENQDTPGIVGAVGTILGNGGVNIANMSLTRNKVGGTAFTVLQLDSEPPEDVRRTVADHPSIVRTYVVDLR